MAIEIKVPSVGESVREALLAEWFKKDGDFVRKDEPLFVIETDKVTLEVVAESDGILKIIIPAGATVAIGAKVGSIEPAEDQPAPASKEKESPSAPAPAAPASTPKTPAPMTASVEQKPENVRTAQAPVPLPDQLPPSVRRLAAEKNLDIARITGTGPDGRITKGDLLLYLERSPAEIAAAPAAVTAPIPQALEERKVMSPIRKRIAQRLLESKQNTAMLTTFNEIDMTNCMEIRNRYKDAFQKRHGVALGFMSFFVKACVEALKEIPEINAFLDKDTVVYHHYQHIGVAVGSERGLVVPVLRHAEKMSFAGIEQGIIDYVAKIKANRLELADLEGGTFTISNGGVYGSLLSTPILNTPQSGILGMHKIEKRPVVIDDQIAIRSMMYVALSYDHRIVDGKGAVTFLRRVKEFIENPERILMEV